MFDIKEVVRICSRFLIEKDVVELERSCSSLTSMSFGTSWVARFNEMKGVLFFLSRRWYAAVVGNVTVTSTRPMRRNNLSACRWTRCKLISLAAGQIDTCVALPWRWRFTTARSQISPFRGLWWIGRVRFLDVQRADGNVNQLEN